MKSQVVMYRDLFNPEENILAKNKLPCRQQYTTTLKSFTKSLKSSMGHSHKCRCKYPRIGEGGYCSNGRCRHSVVEHKQYTEVNYW
jgi:hypothetical protein